MKRANVFLTLITFFIITTLFSCKKDDNGNNNTNNNTKPQSKIEGVWHAYEYHLLERIDNDTVSNDTILYKKGELVYAFRADGMGAIFGSLIDSTAFDYKIIDENTLETYGEERSTIEELTDRKLTLSEENVYTEEGRTYYRKAIIYLEKE